MTTIVRDYMFDMLPEDFIHSTEDRPCHVVSVVDGGVTIVFTRPIWSIRDYGFHDLFVASYYEDEGYEVAQVGDYFYYDFANGAKEAILNSFKKIIKEEVIGVADEADMSFDIEIPESDDIDDLELSITFTGDKYLDMTQEVFAEFIWNYVATFYNMDDAGTFDHPHLWAIAEREMKNA